ncbi:uncharacterized protein LOC133200540 [Saccostrea echinata]|uniref:uncharacterized protein LOC133200540 n=1 Tax=Saccostrea echinata TaxID=191078 RepID=UPI002A81406C|nr:uncharacterized protein LOC133200540 [Saccostrea echinata]
MITFDYKTTRSVSDMLNHLRWASLHERLGQAKPFLMYHIVYQLIDIPPVLLFQSASTRGNSMMFLVPYARTLENQKSFFPDDQSSTLTDDEVSLLYCFLCSDSGPPDFTNTEWLDMLNEIRQRVYGKENPVTSEEAQQTLDRLKSRDYLWEDQDMITEDTKDETMCRIASIKSLLPFIYSSYDTASVYLRSGGYNRKPGEKCVISDDCDYLLINRLQMNILTHVTMEDTSIYNLIYKILNISNQILKDSEDKIEEFLMDLRRGGEAVHNRGRSQDSVDHVTWLWRYEYWARPDIVRSCIGLHPHNDIYIIDNKAYRKPSKYHNYSPEIRCLLYCLLLTEKYQLNLNEQSHRITRDKIRDRYFHDIAEDGLVDPPDGITETQNGVITFTSNDIRHDVMYAFVTECLVEDSDLEFFLTTASRVVISEYCRSWEYKRSEGERCLYVPKWPEKMYDLFIDKLQLDIITHCTMSDGWIHDSISERVGIPYEVLGWHQEARERYVEYAKRGTQTVHHARGMIVGCAGAGKTTLLKRLLGFSEEEVKKVESTEGLEVHEEIFTICDELKSLKAQNSKDKNGEKYTSFDAAKTLTFFDFGGQCVYYACHQIYLTRRAFYVVVVDASKRLDQEVDKKVCDQDGSVFAGWTYGDYFVFWIKSIHTYCCSDNVKDTKPVIIIVATHWEEGNRRFRDTKELIGSLRFQFPKSSYLSQYITDHNVYCTDFTLPLHDLETCFFDIASKKRWNENIPKEWSFFEIEINQKKQRKRILKISGITTEVPEITAKERKCSDKAEKGKQDMLQYFHDAGKALYFNENGLNKEVIIDVQWFIDAFKHIITDEIHFKGILVTQGDWDEYYKTGNLRVRLLEEVWKHIDEEFTEKLKKENQNYESEDEDSESEDKDSESEDESYEEDEQFLQCHKESLLNFMQRLGLLAIGTESHYIPCMNRKEIERELLDLINESESKSSVLIYQFEFLPFFLFFRLVVACMQEEGWNVLKNEGTSCLYRNAALFSYMEYNILLSVNKDSIQLQVFQPVAGYVLERVKTCKIQRRIEEMLINLSGTFYRKIQFVRGFRCQTDEGGTIAMNIENHFLPKTMIPKEDRKMVCPLHSITNRHIIDTTELTRYWEFTREAVSAECK